MKVLVDTNVLLDVLLRREPFLKESALVWAAIEEGRVESFAAAISFNNIFYIVRKELDATRAREAMVILSRLLSVARVDAQVITDAISSKNADFEDAIQEISGLRAGATHIVTRDRTGFEGGLLTVLSPTEFLAFVGLNG